jgi:hypothetical protein
MCNYPISSIHYPISSGRGNWILGIGCWILDICTLLEVLPVANTNNQWRKMFPVLKIDVEAQGETKPHTKGNSNMAMTMLREWNGWRLAGKCPIWHGQDRSHSRGEEELREYSHGYIIYK